MKLYFAVLMELEKANLDNISQFQYAFRPTRQALDIIFILRNLIEKHIEWQLVLPSLFVFDGDLFKAYDTVNHKLGAERLQRKGLRRCTIAAIFREIRNLQSTIKADDLISNPIRRTRSLLQGGPDAPKIFNLILDEDLETFNATCTRNRWGVQLDSDQYVGILCFADNFWLLATQPAHLELMAQTWIDQLRSPGWHVPVSECSWCTTADDSFDATVKWTARALHGVGVQRGLKS